MISTLIMMIWIGVIGSATIHHDDQSNRSISKAVATDRSAGLFVPLEHIPFVGAILLVVSTILVSTYYVTSLDSGIYALGEFVSALSKSGPVFRVVLVVSIATVATALLTLGGTAVVGTAQTGTIIGAFPFSFVILLMIVNLIRRLLKRDRSTNQLEKDINNPRTIATIRTRSE